MGATILGATVLREPIASAAQTVDATIIGPLDGRGNVKVHDEERPSATHFQTRVAVEDEYKFIFGPVTSQALAVRSLTATPNLGAGTEAVGLYIVPQPPGSGTCVTDLNSERDAVTGAVVPGGGTDHLTYPEPLVVSHGGLWCAALLGDTSSADFPLSVTVVGYTF